MRRVLRQGIVLADRPRIHRSVRRDAHAHEVLEAGMAEHGEDLLHFEAAERAQREKNPEEEGARERREDDDHRVASEQRNEARGMERERQDERHRAERGAERQRERENAPWMRATMSGYCVERPRDDRGRDERDRREAPETVPADRELERGDRPAGNVHEVSGAPEEQADRNLERESSRR